MGGPTDQLLIENGTSTSDSQRWAGGRGTFSATATWGGATVALQYMAPDGSTWIDVGPEVTLTADDIGGFELAAGLIRAEVTGGPPSGLYVRARR